MNLPSFGLVGVLLVVFVLLTLSVVLFPASVEEQSLLPLLADFELYHYNECDDPIDQISIQDNETGEILVLDIAFQPRAEPSHSALFISIVSRDTYNRMTQNGFRVINVRRR